VAELVTVAIPAYSERFFPEAFASALAQVHAPLEILVCDDSAGDSIERSVRAADDPRVRYLRNARRLGFSGNFTQCFREAKGDLLKLLNDDDRLLPRCVESLAWMLESNRSVVLATSRRGVIDDAGRARPDIQATMPISLASALIVGRELGDLVLVNAVNLIGEPSTVMFRRSRLAVEADSIFRWGGRDYHCLADLSLWLRLLQSGLGYYCAETLSQFRMHEAQEQNAPGVKLECLVERLWIARQARAAGFLRVGNAWRAALAPIRARARMWQEAQGLDAATRATVDSIAAEIEAELGAGTGGS
jgi:glycosyltransferase involved in cell wall biosynthesis